MLSSVNTVIEEVGLWVRTLSTPAVVKGEGTREMKYGLPALRATIDLR